MTSHVLSCIATTASGSKRRPSEGEPLPDHFLSAYGGDSFNHRKQHRPKLKWFPAARRFYGYRPWVVWALQSSPLGPQVDRGWTETDRNVSRLQRRDALRPGRYGSSLWRPGLDGVAVGRTGTLMRKLTRHHLIPKCQQKPNYQARLPTAESIIWLTREKHDAWHLLFKEATLTQVIEILQRIKKREAWTQFKPFSFATRIRVAAAWSRRVSRQHSSVLLIVHWP